MKTYSKTLFSVHDSKASSYFPPTCYRSRGEALRAFETACKDSQSIFSQYPSDFTFVEIGHFDDESGILVPHSQPIILVNASDFVTSNLPSIPDFKKPESFQDLVDTSN